jgi:hypothetical protein
LPLNSTCTTTPWLNPKDSSGGGSGGGGGGEGSATDGGGGGGEDGGGDRSKGGGKMPMEGSEWRKMRVKILQEKVYVNGHALIHGTSLPAAMGIAHINWTRTKGQKKKYFRQWKMWKC